MLIGESSVSVGSLGAGSTHVLPESAEFLSPDRISRGLGRFCPRTVVATVSSDAHTWNLMYLQLFLEERGHHVYNAGPCSPVRQVVTACLDHSADLLVLSSVNGHGMLEAPKVASAVRGEPGLRALRLVIGGKLNVCGNLGRHELDRLRQAGFDEVFCSATAWQDFPSYVSDLER